MMNTPTEESRDLFDCPHGALGDSPMDYIDGKIRFYCKDCEAWIG